MEKVRIYSAGHTAALSYAKNYLHRVGYRFTDMPENATHLLLPVPSLDSEGCVIGGGPVEPLLKQLPENVTVVGGNLHHNAFAENQTIDLLKDPYYLSENAHITAHCAVQLAMDQLPVIMTGLKVLVIGWGRIGKCLARLLQQMGADVWVAARKEADRAMIDALGYRSMDTANLDTEGFPLVFNTAPVMLLPQSRGTGLKIDLASQLGLGGMDVVWARGLPGRYAPESSGTLIGRTLDRILHQEDAL